MYDTTKKNNNDERAMTLGISILMSHSKRDGRSYISHFENKRRDSRYCGPQIATIEMDESLDNVDQSHSVGHIKS